MIEGRGSAPRHVRRRTLGRVIRPVDGAKALTQMALTFLALTHLALTRMPG